MTPQIAHSISRIWLSLLLLLAICIGAGGLLAARREVEFRRERDRTAHRAFISAMQTKARELEQLYEAHLKRIGLRLTSSWREGLAARQIASAVEGIQRVSWLFWKSANTETHLDITTSTSASPPEPTLETTPTGLPRPRVLLEAADLFPDATGDGDGWIDAAGKPLMFFVRQGATAVVFTLDRSAVANAMTSHFRTGSQSTFASLAQLGGPDVLRDATGQDLCLSGRLPAMHPDFVMPVVSRFGTWQLASWDQREKHISYHAPTLAGAMALSVLVAVLGIGLSAQQARAARLAAQRVSFVNRVSHELRTPMTNILLNLDIIEENIPETSAPRFGLIREEAGRLSRLIENVLTFSQSEEGRLKLHPFHVSPAEIVDRVVDQFEPALLRRHITLTRVHEGSCAQVMLDADALSQITANLLSNVEKYAPDAPALVHTQQTADAFTLTVSDAGKGIPVSDAERIFHPFTRLDDRVQAGVSGTGLGLSIARDLAQRMGGTLRLIPSEKGSRFEFTLPLSPTSPP